MTFPSDTVDTCHTSVTIQLCARDIVKVLLGAPIRVHVEVASRTLIEKCGSRADTVVKLPLLQKVRTLFSRVPPQAYTPEDGRRDG